MQINSPRKEQNKASLLLQKAGFLYHLDSFTIKFFPGNRGAPQAHFLILLMTVDARIGKTAVLITLELEDGIVHQRLIKYSQVHQQLKILLGQTRNLGKSPGSNCMMTSRRLRSR